MKIAGIIAEYNPFHNGHAWHVDETRRRTGCDSVVACMAGHFTQRGEPTPWSKWDRARMALAGGVDAVFEMPALFAVRTADAFARGGVAILGRLGCDALSFGSETADLALLRTLADWRAEEPEALSRAVRANLDAGMSHAKARGEAVAALLGVEPEAVNRPNLILAAEYLRAIAGGGFAMEPVAVERRGGYHDAAVGEYASAGAIRVAIARGDAASARAAMPDWTEPDAMHPMDDLLLAALRRMDLEQLAALPDVSEGLEHRLYAACREASGREDLLDRLKCRRYTRARLSRLLTHALLGVDRAFVEAHPAPAYARLLGAREGAGPLLKELSARAAIPIVTRATALRGDPVFDLECRATDAWALLHDAPECRRMGREFTAKFVKESAGSV